MEQIKGLDTRKLRHRGLLGVTAKNGSGDPVSPPKKNKGTLEHETKEYVHNLDVFGSWFFYFFVGCWVGTNTLFFGLDAILRLFYLFVELWDIVGRSAIFLCHLSCHPKNRPVHDHFDLSAAASCPGHFYPDNVAHVSATMKPKTCHISFILLPKGKILIIKWTYYFYLLI